MEFLLLHLTFHELPVLILTVVAFFTGRKFCRHTFKFKKNGEGTIVKVECDDDCLPHSYGCDGMCDHSSDHRNGCWPKEED
jgi:hypothetical protein